MFMRYLAPTARQPVEISEPTRVEIKMSLDKNLPQLFNKAQEEVESFMKSLFLPFQRSEFYPQLLKKIEQIGAKKKNARQFSVYDQQVHILYNLECIK